jgi:purine-binding chemotaxis protein CheW
MNALVQAANPAARAPLPAPPAGSPPEQGQYLIFSLGGEAFAIGILAIKEIIEYGAITEVPMMPAAVRGVINLRGAVVPVIDLAARFGKPLTEAGRRTCIVIVELTQAEARQDVGLIVDAVTEVIDIGAGEIEPPPSFGARIRTEFIRGMARRQARFVIVLDIERVLAMEDIAGAAQAAGALAAAETALA